MNGVVLFLKEYIFLKNNPFNTTLSLNDITQGTSYGDNMFFKYISACSIYLLNHDTVPIKGNPVTLT